MSFSENQSALFVPLFDNLRILFPFLFPITGVQKKLTELDRSVLRLKNSTFLNDMEKLFTPTTADDSTLSSNKFDTNHLSQALERPNRIPRWIKNTVIYFIKVTYCTTAAAAADKPV